MLEFNVKVFYMKYKIFNTFFTISFCSIKLALLKFNNVLFIFKLEYKNLRKKESFT